MSRGGSQVVYVSWYNSSVGVGSQTSDRCDSWDVLETISVSKNSVVSIGITFGFTLTKVVSIWISSISVMDWGSNSDVMEDWSSLGSKMLSGGSGNSWGISWDDGSVSISGEGSNRGDWSSSENMDSWVRFGFTLTNEVTIWPSSVSMDISGMKSWGSSGSKMGGGGSSYSWGIGWYNSSVSIGGESSNRGDWGSSWDKDISIRVSFTLSKVVSIWPSSISVMDWGSDSDVMEDWSSFGSKMLSGGSGDSWGISWDNSAISIGGKSTDRGDWGSSEDVDSWVSFAIGFTLSKVVSIWVSSISVVSNKSGVESWGSSSSKMG